MKHGKKPTMAQKIQMKWHGLNPENWLVVKDTPDSFEIVNRLSSKIRKFTKG